MLRPNKGSPVLALSATFQGVRSAPTDTVGDAADARWPSASEHEERVVYAPTTRSPCGFLRDGRTQVSAPRVVGAYTTSSGESDRFVTLMYGSHLELAICGIANQLAAISITAFS